MPSFTSELYSITFYNVAIDNGFNLISVLIKVSKNSSEKTGVHGNKITNGLLFLPNREWKICFYISSKDNYSIALKWITG